MTTSAKSRWLWVGLGLVVLLTVVWDAVPLPDAVGHLAALPKRGADFVSRDLPLASVEDKALGPAAHLKRLYAWRGQRFEVLAVDGTHNRHVVHDPQYCLRGAGWQLVSQHPIPLGAGEAMLCRFVRGDRAAEALYWYTDGEIRHASPLRYWWQATLRRLTLGVSGNEPILVIVQPFDEDPMDWPRLTTNFLPLLTW